MLTPQDTRIDSATHSLTVRSSLPPETFSTTNFYTIPTNSRPVAGSGWRDLTECRPTTTHSSERCKIVHFQRAAASLAKLWESEDLRFPPKVSSRDTRKLASSAKLLSQPQILAMLRASIRPRLFTRVLVLTFNVDTFPKYEHCAHTRHTQVWEMYQAPVSAAGLGLEGQRRS